MKWKLTVKAAGIWPGSGRTGAQDASERGTVATPSISQSKALMPPDGTWVRRHAPPITYCIIELCNFVSVLRRGGDHARNPVNEISETPASMNDTSPHAPVATLRMGDAAPDFEARSTQGPVRLSDYRDRWLVFFSHPADFTPVCTTEFVALAKAHDLFTAMGCALLGLSVDSLYAHLAWTQAIRELFSVEVPFPVIEDPSMVVGRTYGMIDDKAESSAGVRATYFIDPKGVIRAITHYPLTIGRSIDEMVRMVAALQASYSGEKLAPADWQPGSPLLLPANERAQIEPDWFCRSAA